MNRMRANDTHGMSCWIVAVASVFLSAHSVFANVPVLSVAQIKQMVRLQEMRWLTTLSDRQIEEVRSALRSKHGMIVEPAVHNVVLHRLDDLLPLIKGKVNSPETDRTWPLCEICSKILNFDGNPCGQLRQALTTELPGDEFIPNCEKIDYCRPVRHMITSLIVIDEIRAVRAAKKKAPDLNGLVLSEFQKALVRYSRMESGTVITHMVDDLAASSAVGAKEIDILRVLRTYSIRRYAASVLSKLEGAPEANYGNGLLVRSFQGRRDELTSQEVARLRSIIETIRTAGPRPSMESLLSAMESELE